MRATIEQVPEVFDALRCPHCGLSNYNWQSSNHSDHPFGSPARLLCLECRNVARTRNGYLDMLGDQVPDAITPIQQIMQFPPAVAIYEGLWRPFGYFIASKHSFEDDAQRITKWTEPQRRGLILDLACGPGVFTRRLAAAARDSLVVGFDLSHQMLERAVRLTREDGLRNILYIRGSAHALPFKPETFDVLICCGALQLFTDQDQAMGEIARVLKAQGDFVCQTTLGPRLAPLWVRLADNLLKFGYFHLDDLKALLNRFNFHVVDEEKSRINYIFRAEKKACLST